jgi:hypothetical protein
MALIEPIHSQRAQAIASRSKGVPVANGRSNQGSIAEENMKMFDPIHVGML